MKTENLGEKREPQIFKEVDQNILEYKQMEQFILQSLKTEGQKMPVPHLRFPDATTEKQDGHNFTLSSGMNNRGTHDDAENIDPLTAKHAYGFT